ncbi:APC family permease [Microbacterium sp. LWH10-1.2]|uniref:APC family permease n=1 Tax=Microbacterium sp. LWH10-1.2 TaxID=3135255 RepID=UPI003138B8EC
MSESTKPLLPTGPGSSASGEAAPDAEHPVTGGISRKGLSVGTVGVMGALVMGISCIAPAYTYTAGIGGAVGAVGFQVPAILLLGFIPMLLVAFGYRELNNAMPDSGTSFTWATRAFGPYVGWMAGWGLIVATILVLSNLAGIAVDFLFLLISQISGNEAIAEITRNPFVNVAVCLIFVALAAWVSYRDVSTSQKLQYGLVAFQIVILVVFAVMAIVQTVQGGAFEPHMPELSWFNPFAIQGGLSVIVMGLSASVFMFWGWDVTLTMNEEAKDPERTPGRAAMLTVLSIIAIYLLLTVSSLMYSGIGDKGLGLMNEEIGGNVFFALSGPVMGGLAFLLSLAVLTSSASSLQSTFISPARTLLAMGHYGAVPQRFAGVNPRFFTPGFATIASAIVAGGFYAVMRFLSEDALWDTILALGMMICFYYGITALSCVWYFRHQWFDSGKDFFFKLASPLVGGVILLVLFVVTAIDSLAPDFGSIAIGADANGEGGIGIVFFIGVGLLVFGAVLMLVQRIVNPEFFRGKTLSVDAPPSARRR